MARVGIVICNYNKAEMVCQCIQSVLESKYTDYRLYVVDNASTDGSAERILEQFANQVELIVNPENLGGSGGFNAGMRRALLWKQNREGAGISEGHEYLWCLDNDVLVDENALGALVEFLDGHPKCGMAGSRVDHMEAPDYVQQYGITVDFENFCVEAKYRNHPEDGTLPEVVYSDAVAACSVLVRRSLIDRIGLMPEDNFLYWDDTEWGYRCNLAGYQVASCGKSIVLHAMGAKKESVNTFPTYYAWRNWIDFFARYTPEEKLEAMCQSFLRDIFDIVYEGLYRGEESKAKTVMSAYDDALHGVRGRAPEGRIMPMDTSDDKLAGLLSGKKKVLIEAGEYEGYAQALAEKIAQLSPETDIRIVASGDSTGKEQGNDTIGKAGAKDTLIFHMCNFIFYEEDLSLTKIYADINGNFLATEDDVLMMINYPYSRRMFLYSQMPLFQKCVSELREKRKSFYERSTYNE